MKSLPSCTIPRRQIVGIEDCSDFLITVLVVLLFMQLSAWPNSEMGYLLHTSNAITHTAYCTSAPKLPLPHSHFICKPQALSRYSYCSSDQQGLYQHWPLADGPSKQATPSVNWILLPLWAPVPSQLFPAQHRPPARCCKSVPARMAVLAAMWTVVLGEPSSPSTGLQTPVSCWLAPAAQCWVWHPRAGSFSVKPIYSSPFWGPSSPPLQGETLQQCCCGRSYSARTF